MSTETKTAKEIFIKHFPDGHFRAKFEVRAIQAMEEFASQKEIKYPTEADANEFAELRASVHTANPMLALTEAFNGYMVAIEKIKELNKYKQI